MAEGSKLYSIVFTLGLVSAFIVLMYSETGVGGGPPGLAEVAFPSFRNPFDEGNQVNRYTSVPTTPIRNTTGSAPYVSWVGCDNTTAGRQFCINSDDFESSYFQANFTNAEATDHGFLFNITSRTLQNAVETNIRRYTWTIECRTVSGERPAIFEAQIYGVFSVTTLVCPFGNFHRIVFDKSTPAGVGAYGPAIFDGAITFRNSDAIEFGTAYSAVVQLSFARLDVIEGDGTSGTGCQAPDGAWFPWADETACAIGQLGQIVWKGILFVINGLVYLGEWFIVIGGVIAGLIAIIAWFYAIPGMPSVIQGFVDVWLTANAVMLFYIVAKLLRGNE